VHESASRSDAERNLLFGILALQLDFIDRDALYDAMQAWVLEKAAPLGQILLKQQKLNREQLHALDVVFEQHLKMHGDNPELSLQAVRVSAAVPARLSEIDDVDVQSSLGRHVSTISVVSTIAVDTPSRMDRLPTDGVRYQKLRHHAGGGLGDVYVATDNELHREVALKEIKEKFAYHSGSRVRFILEAEITGGLEHPGIVPVYGLGTHADGRPYYAMRFIRGDNLKVAIERFHAADKPGRNASERSLAFRQLLRRYVDVCNAVAYAHSRGVVHRDLKPANVMLGKFGETLVVDWGLAKAGTKDQNSASTNGADGERTLRPASGSSVEETSEGMLIGTPPFMSPEQAEGRVLELSHASDIYSLGSTLYALLTGRIPYDGSTKEDVIKNVRRGEFLPPQQVKPGTPPALDAICRKAMSFQPQDRYAGVLALAADVDHWLADEPVAAYSEPWTARASRWARRHRSAVAGIAAFLVCAVIALAITTALVSAEQRRTDAQRKIAVENHQVARDQSFNIIRLIESSEPELAMVPALHDRRAELLNTASDACRQFLKQDQDNLELIAQSARIFRFAGNFERLINQTRQAESYYKDAIKLDERLIGAFPQKYEFRLQQSDIHRDYANLLVNVGQLKQAVTNLEESESIAEDLWGGDRENPVFRRSLALALLNKARVEYRQGKSQESQTTTALKRSTDLFRGLVVGAAEHRHGYDPLLLAAALNLTGMLQREGGDLEAAEKTHAEAALLFKETQEAKPAKINEADINFFRAECQIEQAKTWAKIAKPRYVASAKENMGQAINKLVQLSRTFPKIPVYQESVARAFRERGDVLIQMEDFAGARDHFQKAHDLLVALTTKYDQLPELHAELGKSYAGLGKAAQGLKDGEHQKYYQQATLEIRKAIAIAPDDARFKQWLTEAEAAGVD
jgi:serine/threonine protein kinase/tetratricopeptide (TPR) repeat protein